MQYAGLLERLNTLLLQASTALYLHASNPRVKGNDREHLRQWAAAHEVRTALLEQNPAFASQLLPSYPSLAAINGLPLLPTGLRWAVDEKGAAGKLTFSAEVAGVTFSVTAPDGKAFVPKPTALATRTVATFDAPLDGLYAVTLHVGSIRLAIVLVPVNRALLRALRRNNQQNAYAFRERLPDPNPAYVSRLARWIAADAAAATGQPSLYYLLSASAEAVPQAPTPIAIYPHLHD
jgi:hypothetical protein